jgi:ABC-type antimicrobial peptide transport system ATPase subunit
VFKLNKHEVFEKLELLNISKVYVSFFYENGKVDIISNMVIMKDGRSSISWDHDVYSDKSYIVKPIFDYEKDDWTIIDGLLTWDIINKKLIISGEKEKSIKHKFSSEL